MSDELQDVSTSSPGVAADIAVADSSSAAVESSVAQSGIAGGATATEGQSAAEQQTEIDPLDGVPSLEQLQQEAESKVPYAQSLVQLRSAYEQSKSALDEIKPLESYKPLSQRGDPETLIGKLDLIDGLFAPKVGANGQPELDPSSGIPLHTTTPFLEKANEQNPGLVEQLAADVLQFKTLNPVTGQEEPIIRQVFRELGLNPDDLDRYRKIDTLIANTGTAITPEELAAIPPELHEAFKSLPSSIRDSLWNQDEDSRKFTLEAQKERLDRNQATQAAEAKQQEAAKQQETAIKEYVSGEQDKYIAEQRQEGYAAVRNDLAQKVTFSSDPKINNLMLSLSCLLPVAAMDPELRFGVTEALKEIGVQLEPSFDEALVAANTHSRQFKAYDLAGLKLQRDDALAKARGAKAMVSSKASLIALEIAKALGGQVQQRASQNGKLLAGATTTRPIPGNGQSVSETQGILPQGIDPMSPEANRLVAQRARLIG